MKISSFSNFAILFLCLVSLKEGSSKVECDSDQVCIEKLREGSVCGEDGYCTNPFASGCLRRLLGQDEYPTPRICHSEDPPGSPHCSMEPLIYLNYTEIRVAPADWDSAIFLAWIYQILLMELMQVPVTIERGNGKTGETLDFYDTSNNYGERFPVTSYSVEGIERSTKLPYGDCRLTKEPCAHVLTEVWPGTDPIEGTADRLFTGQMGIEGFWMPQYTIEKDPSLASYFGLAGEANRQKLAEMFKRPTTWGDYCTYVSDCLSNDEVAARAPLDDYERGRYFVENLYTGHFRYTDHNNCTANPGNCTGHIVDYPCTWNPVTEQQLFWNNISLLATDNDAPYYSGGSLGEIFHAANWTKSDVIVLFWKPEPSFDQFEYIKVAFPFPNTECIENRRPKVNRCEASHESLVGSPKGACDLAILPLEKFVSLAVQRSAFSTPLDTRSPAYQFLTKFTIQNIQIERLLKNWFSRKIDRSGYDPREAICVWVAQNIDHLKTFVPPGYPRQIGETKDLDYYESALPIIGIAFGSLATAILLVVWGATHFYRKHKVMVIAQIPFLYLFCLGYLSVSLAGIFHALLPSDHICVAREWLVVFGYTVALAPLAVKLAVMNQLVRNARLLRRVHFSQTKLFFTSSILVAIAVLYLITWTILDPPTRSIEIVLRNSTSNVVDAHILCSTERKFWGGGALGWEGILIFYSFILAVQTKRNTRKMKKIPELQMVGNMAYVSFMLFVFRSVVFYLPDDAVKPQTRAGADSILLSLDAILSILVYFIPKFYLIRRGGSANIDFSSAAESYISNYSQASMKLENVNCPNCAYTFLPTPATGSSNMLLQGTRTTGSMVNHAGLSIASEGNLMSVQPSIAEEGAADVEESSEYCHDNGELKE